MNDNPIHPWRWRALALWIVVFTLAVGLSLRSISDESVKVAQLQHTNCGLFQFLLTARRARWDAYLRTHHVADFQAVLGYEHIVEPYVDNQQSVGHCAVSPKILIKQRPLGHIPINRPN